MTTGLWVLPVLWLKRDIIINPLLKGCIFSFSATQIWKQGRGWSIRSLFCNHLSGQNGLGDGVWHPQCEALKALASEGLPRNPPWEVIKLCHLFKVAAFTLSLWYFLSFFYAKSTDWTIWKRKKGADFKPSVCPIWPIDSKKIKSIKYFTNKSWC